MSTAQAVKADLTTATATSGERVSPPEYDTTTPMDQDVLPFTMILMAKWGTWLLARLQQHWPHLTPFNWKGIIANFTNQNGCIFIKSRRAILLATYARDALETRPVVKVIFCFKFDPEAEDQDKDVKMLWQRVIEWGRGLGAKQIRIENPDTFDMPLNKINGLCGGGATTGKYYVRDLDK